MISLYLFKCMAEFMMLLDASCRSFVIVISVKVMLWIDAVEIPNL